METNYNSWYIYVSLYIDLADFPIIQSHFVYTA